ncbi:MAG TPA: hypothetical protein VGI75_03240 [Pirellulales bacterium]|jgi:hypothetical protein
MKRQLKTKNTIDSPPTNRITSPPHDRDQLRRKLLKMILQNEAQRRGLIPKTRVTFIPRPNLAVFDPDNRIGAAALAGSLSSKPA